MFNETTNNEETLITTTETEEQIEVEVTNEVITSKSESSITDYLDKSILNIKVVSLDELGQYSEDELGELDEMYLESFTDIKEGEVATGTVVNITDREVFIDMGKGLLETGIAWWRSDKFIEKLLTYKLISLNITNFALGMHEFLLLQ